MVKTSLENEIEPPQSIDSEKQVIYDRLYPMYQKAYSKINENLSNTLITTGGLEILTGMGLEITQNPMPAMCSTAIGLISTFYGMKIKKNQESKLTKYLTDYSVGLKKETIEKYNQYK